MTDDSLAPTTQQEDSPRSDRSYVTAHHVIMNFGDAEADIWGSTREFSDNSSDEYYTARASAPDSPFQEFYDSITHNGSINDDINSLNAAHNRFDSIWTEPTWSFAGIPSPIASTSSFRRRASGNIHQDNALDMTPERGSNSAADALAPALIIINPNPPQPGNMYIDLLDRITICPHPDAAVRFSTLSVLRRPSGFYRVIAESKNYHSPWHSFRFLDLPPTIRNRVYEHWLLDSCHDDKVNLADHRAHDAHARDHELPCWMPNLCKAHIQLREEAFPLFLRNTSFIARSVLDLEWLHGVLSGFQGPNGADDNGYRYIHALCLPHFFASPGPINQHRNLELSLLDKCTNLEMLEIGINTEILTRQVSDTESIRLQKLKPLEEILITYGFPHIFDCRRLTHLYLEAYDDEDTFRNSIDEPLRLFITLAEWMEEGFQMRIRNARVLVRVRDGRFSSDGESIPGHMQALPQEPTVTELPRLERRLRRHWMYANRQWEVFSRARITDPWSVAVDMGVDRADVVIPGQVYQI